MKALLADHWRTVTPEQKMAIRKYCVDYLRNESLVLSRANSVVRMMILLLAKIVKLGWFDDPEVRNAIVPDLTLIIEQGNDQHKLIGLQAIQQLIIEMTYLTKMKNLQINRRLSLNFRDSALYKIFCDNIEFTKALTAKLAQEGMQM